MRRLRRNAGRAGAAQGVPEMWSKESAMTPYYQHAGITIYHGDCREILPTLQADLVVTDPPYGMNFRSRYRIVKHDAIAGDAFLPLDPLISLYQAVIPRPSRSSS